MTDAELFSHFSNLVQTIPDLYNEATDSDEKEIWLAKLDSLLNIMRETASLVELRLAINRGNNFGPNIFNESPKIIKRILLRTHALLELKVAPASRGAFIPVGSALDAYRLLSQIFGTAKKKIMVVDPYLDDKIIVEFLMNFGDSITIELLADAYYHKPSLKVASQKWLSQHSSERPLETRLSREKTLHDRLIIIDELQVWNVSQSFKDIAARSPASISKFYEETAKLKVVAYSQFWTAASPI